MFELIVLKFYDLNIIRFPFSKKCQIPNFKLSYFSSNFNSFFSRKIIFKIYNLWVNGKGAKRGQNSKNFACLEVSSAVELVQSDTWIFIYLLAIVLFVLWFMASDYPLVSSKLFLCWSTNQWLKLQCIWIVWYVDLNMNFKYFTVYQTLQRSHWALSVSYIMNSEHCQIRFWQINFCLNTV